MLDPTPLVAWRAPLEERVLAATDDGVRAIVVRPGLVYGHAGGVPAMLVFGSLGEGVIKHVGDGLNRWASVHHRALTAGAPS